MKIFKISSIILLISVLLFSNNLFSKKISLKDARRPSTTRKYSGAQKRASEFKRKALDRARNVRKAGLKQYLEEDLKKDLIDFFEKIKEIGKTATTEIKKEVKKIRGKDIKKESERHEAPKYIFEIVQLERTLRDANKKLDQAKVAKDKVDAEIKKLDLPKEEILSLDSREREDSIRYLGVLRDQSKKLNSDLEVLQGRVFLLKKQIDERKTLKEKNDELDRLKKERDEITIGLEGKISGEESEKLWKANEDISRIEKDLGLSKTIKSEEVFSNLKTLLRDDNKLEQGELEQESGVRFEEVEESWFKEEPEIEKDKSQEEKEIENPFLGLFDE